MKEGEGDSHVRRHLGKESYRQKKSSTKPKKGHIAVVCYTGVSMTSKMMIEGQSVRKGGQVPPGGVIMGGLVVGVCLFLSVRWSTIKAFSYLKTFLV